MKKIIIASLAILFLAGCNKDFVLKVNKTSLSFDAKGGSQKIEITSDVFWDIAGGGEDWYSLSVKEGEGNATVEINVKEYDEAAGRSAELTISGGGIFRTLTLTQVRPPLPQNPSELKYNINSLDQELEIKVPEIYAYKVEIEGGASFVKVVKTEKGKFTLSFDANMTDKSREVSLSVKTSDDKMIETAKVVQSWRSVEPGELLIEEVFFTGALIPGSNRSDSSDGDQYFKLTNTTNKTIYADRLLITISKTGSQSTSTGAVMEYPELPDSLGVATIYQIPGNGKDVAIAPGKSLVIALAAQNFSKSNPNGIDLSKADFEVYDENDRHPDTDNPDVKNLSRWFAASLSITTLHNRGYESYAIAIPPANINSKNFTENYKWEGKYVFKFKNIIREIEIKGAYLIPNSWVLDGINCAVEEYFYKLAWNPSTDAGYTYCGKIDMDPTRYGKSVRRKNENGKFKDTNNSTNDFIHEAVPSLKK